MGLSTCAKGAIACGVCTAVILAIMIPVGILVIAPALGQHALTSATMMIPNCTVYNLPEDLPADPDGGRISNSIELTQQYFPFNSKLLATDMIMHLPPGHPDIIGFSEDPTSTLRETDLAWFTLPEQVVKHGLTKFQIDQQLDVVNPSTFVTMAFGLIRGGNAPFPYNDSFTNVEIWIVGKPKLVALGFVTIGPLRLGKKLNCTFNETLNPLPDSGVLESESETLTGRRLQGKFPAIGLTCIQAGDLKDDQIDSVMDNRASHGGFCTNCSSYTTTTMATTTTTVAPIVA